MFIGSLVKMFEPLTLQMEQYACKLLDQWSTLRQTNGLKVSNEAYSLD